MLVHVGIALKGRSEFELFIDARQPRSDQGSEGQVRVEIGTADAAFDTDRFAALGAQAKARGAIVAAPHRAGRGEGA
ncbi:hypothetical protein D3C76_1758010 [compost metagenome]